MNNVLEINLCHAYIRILRMLVRSVSEWWSIWRVPFKFGLMLGQLVKGQLYLTISAMKIIIKVRLYRPTVLIHFMLVRTSKEIYRCTAEWCMEKVFAHKANELRFLPQSPDLCQFSVNILLNYDDHNCERLIDHLTRFTAYDHQFKYDWIFGESF